MAVVTGPIATMPGARFSVPEGTPCDDCGKPATVRVQGETDSFGAEMEDLCAECAKRFRPGQSYLREGDCEWCNKPAIDRLPRRDYDEGMCGCVYLVCLACRERHRREVEADLEDCRNYDDSVDEG